jgi:hypothetical protein
MPSKNRDIANFLGKTETANTDNVALASADGGSGLQVYATLDDLPTTGLTSGDQAYITATNRIYISNGSGWYNVALLNATPGLSISPSGAITLATDGSTPTVITLTGTDSDNADASLIYSVESDGSFSNIATLSQDSSVFTITPLAEGSATPGSSTLTFKASDGISFGSGTTEFSLTFGPDWSATPTESILRASDGQANDRLGSGNDEAGAISGDGSYVIIGAQLEDGGAGDPYTSAGAAYIFSRSGSTWTQQAKLQASDITASQNFGSSCSINNDGTYAIVGGSGTNSNTGAAYIFTRSGSTWTQQQKITASDAQQTDYFGMSVSINSDATYAIVTAPYEDTNGAQAGAAYIFSRSGSTWSQQAKIQSTEIQASDQFGYQTAMSGDGTYIAVSAPFENGGAGDPVALAGAVYVFTGSGSTWSQQAKLVSDDIVSNDRFGHSVSINNDGTCIIVGVNRDDGYVGAAYVFTRSGSTWSQQAKLTASDGQAYDNFGWSVSITADGNIALISATGEDGGAGDPISAAGAAYIFTRSGSTWTQVRKLTASDAQTGDSLGTTARLNGDGTYAAIAAAQEDGGAGDPISGAGALYIYEA